MRWIRFAIKEQDAKKFKAYAASIGCSQQEILVRLIEKINSRFSYKNGNNIK